MLRLKVLQLIKEAGPKGITLRELSDTLHKSSIAILNSLPVEAPVYEDENNPIRYYYAGKMEV